MDRMETNTNSISAAAAAYLGTGRWGLQGGNKPSNIVS
jgi:hypothetical protein